MANGAPSPNGQAELMLHEARQREAEQRELIMMLKQTLTNPHAEHRYKTCVVGVAWQTTNGVEYPLILVALPNGERLEFPITDGERRAIIGDLSKPDASETDNATRGGVELD